MRAPLFRLYHSLREAIWPLPALVIVLFLIAAGLLLGLDHSLTLLQLLPSGSPEQFSRVLSATATTAFSAALILLSITMMTLAISANQYGSRLLRRFMQHRYTQLVLGYYGGLFVFCLALLAFVDRHEQTLLALSITLVLLLAIGAVAILLYYLHQVSRAIQAPNIIATLGRDLRSQLNALPTYDGKEEEEQPQPTQGEVLKSLDGGYLQKISEAQLVELAQKEGCLIRLNIRPGDYVVANTEIGRVEGCSKQLDERASPAFNFGAESKRTHDLEYSVRQLVEVALRALSPSTLDHFNCLNALDELFSAIHLASTRSFPNGLCFDPDGQLRLVKHAFRFESLVDQALDQIRQNASSNPAHYYVTLHLLEGLDRLTDQIAYPERAALVRRQANLVREMAEKAATQLPALDRARLTH